MVYICLCVCAFVCQGKGRRAFPFFDRLMEVANRMVRILSADDVKKCITMATAIQLQRRAFLALRADSGSVTPERVLLDVPGEGITLFKPAYFDGSQKVLGAKIVSVRPKNSDKHMNTVPGSIILFDAETGFTRSLMDAEYLTGLRTAAGSGVFTDMYASATASNMVVFGAGLQAEEHVKAVFEVRPSVKTVTFVNRTATRALDLIDRLRGAFPNVDYGACIPGEAAKIKAALGACDIICTCTNASMPLFKYEDLEGNARNVHVNAIGSFTPTMQELPSEMVSKAVADGVVVCDSSHALAVGEFSHLSSEESKRVAVACDVLASGGAGE